MGFQIPSVVSIAGSDSSGGAGVQADIKTIEAMGLFAQSAITALTAQNTLGVAGVHDVPAAFVAQQIDSVFQDIRPAAVKIGMVSQSEIIGAIAERLSAYGARNIVVDPVMVATSGSRLINEDAQKTLVSKLFPMARVVTPNIPEAQVLADMAIETKRDMETAAVALSEQCGAAVLVKGGHGVSDADDVLADGATVRWLRGNRIDNPNTHGTGCTLSSAIACGLACGDTVEQACARAKTYISHALASRLDLGKGSGPLDHMWQFRQEFTPLADE